VGNLEKKRKLKGQKFAGDVCLGEEEGDRSVRLGISGISPHHISQPGGAVKRRNVES